MNRKRGVEIKNITSDLGTHAKKLKERFKSYG